MELDAPKSTPHLPWRVLVTADVIRRAGRFAVSGVLVTCLHIVIAASLIEFIFPRPALANGIAFVVATFASYTMNTFWSFSQSPALKTLLRFVTVAIVGLSITMALSGLASFYGFSYWVGIFCVVIIVPPCTFLMHSFWTYR